MTIISADRKRKAPHVGFDVVNRAVMQHNVQHQADRAARHAMFNPKAALCALDRPSGMRKEGTCVAASACARDSEVIKAHRSQGVVYMQAQTS